MPVGVSLDLRVDSARTDGRFMDRSPSFDRDGIVAPMCTHADHRRAGLARTLICEGLDRLAARGARTASVETGEGGAANALYASIGSTEVRRVRPWWRVGPDRWRAWDLGLTSSWSY